MYQAKISYDALLNVDESINFHVENFQRTIYDTVEIIHLCFDPFYRLSIASTFIVIGLVFFIWYPSPLATAVGVTHIFLMMLVIDVILGPLLGLLVYKEGKKTLKFDLSVIILIQISALCYGVFSIEQGRPAWLVYSVDRFELVRKNELVDTEYSTSTATIPKTFMV